MGLNKLAIVGRPNVGKSSLFNKICKKRHAIVSEEEGVTRDRLHAHVNAFSKDFIIIDTGGIDLHSKKILNEEIKRQAIKAIQEADSIIMVVDVLVGVTTLDKEVAEILLKSKKPITLAVNKIDNENRQNLVHDFYSLGIENIVPISALHEYNIDKLIETSFEGFSFENEVTHVSQNPRIALIGRANVGKSTLLNSLLDENRALVSPISGTTRDNVDVIVSYDDNDYTFIDTAGIRRKNKEKSAIEKFSFIRTKEAIEQSDICLLLLDATEGLTFQEKKILQLIDKNKKGCILLFNKWDLVKDAKMEDFLRLLREKYPHFPPLVISAKTKRNIDKIFPLINIIEKNRKKRIITSHLNKFIEQTIQKHHPAMIKGKRFRMYYMTQVSVNPPHFVCFVNYPNLLMESYKKYLLNQFRKHFDFQGTPLIFDIRKRLQND